MGQLLSDLREPPVVGRFYMVPVAHAEDYCGLTGDLPVIGPSHTDVEHFNFPHRHYHVDGRFLKSAERAKLRRYWRGADEFNTVGALPLSNYSSGGIPVGRPRLARRKCTSAATPYRHGHRAAVKALRQQYGEIVEPVRLFDGRVLCPHRKADLTQFAPDADGLVICPLHGLRVCVAARALGTPTSNGDA